jgi:hypothetical protein
MSGSRAGVISHVSRADGVESHVTRGSIHDSFAMSISLDLTIVSRLDGQVGLKKWNTRSKLKVIQLFHSVLHPTYFLKVHENAL